MPAKLKTSTKVTAKAKRAAIAEAFGDIPVDPTEVNWFYARRNLASVRDPVRRGWRDPKYIVESFDVEQVIWKTLDRIYERDGAKFFMEAAAQMLGDITVAVEHRGGPRALRRVIAESYLAH
jgi:hypothetical protein